MTGRLDTVYDDVPGKPSDDEQATWTFMTSELVVYSVTGRGPTLRRASTRRGGPWPQTDGPGVGFGVGRVTTHDDRRVACDSEDSSRVSRDVVHNPIMSTLIPHKTTGFVLVEPCFTYVGPTRVKAEAAKIRALAGKQPLRVSSLRCPKSAARSARRG